LPAVVQRVISVSSSSLSFNGLPVSYRDGCLFVDCNSLFFEARTLTDSTTSFEDVSSESRTLLDSTVSDVVCSESDSGRVLSCCPFIGCNNPSGAVTLAEVCNSDYISRDTPLHFCEQHFDFMFILYTTYKELEKPYIHLIKNPFSERIFPRKPLELHFVEKDLSAALEAREKFQSHIKSQFTHDAFGHHRWMSLIRSAIETAVDDAGFNERPQFWAALNRQRRITRSRTPLLTWDSTVPVSLETSRTPSWDSTVVSPTRHWELQAFSALPQLARNIKAAAVRAVNVPIDYVRDTVASVMRFFSHVNGAFRNMEDFMGQLAGIHVDVKVNYFIHACVSFGIGYILYHVGSYVADLVGTILRTLIDVVPTYFRSLLSTMSSAQDLIESKSNPHTSQLAGENLEPQGPAGLVAVSAGLMAFLASPVKDVKSREIPLATRLLDAIKIISPIVAVAAVSADAMGYIISVLPENFKTYVLKYVGIESVVCNVRTQSLITRSAALLDNWIDNAQQGAKFDVDMAQETVNVYRDLVKERGRDVLLARSPAVSIVLNKHVEDLQVLANQCALRLGTGAVRRVPIAFYIWGPPGCGKTTLVTDLAFQLFPETPAIRRRHVYSAEDQFWSNYNGQPLVHIDDYGATQNTKATEFNGLLLKLIGDAPYSLPMASVAEKGTAFTSSSLVITTNRDPTASIPGIVCREAFMRRFLFVHASVRVEYKRYFRNNAMDLDGVILPTPMAHMEFKLYMADSTGKLISAHPNSVSYEELVLVGKYLLAKRERQFRASVNALEGKVAVNLENVGQQLSRDLFPGIVPAPIPVVQLRQEGKIDLQMFGHNTNFTDEVFPPCPLVGSLTPPLHSLPKCPLWLTQPHAVP